MNRDSFNFKHFKISHDRTAMRVGTDGVLLGAWCDLNDAKRILDIGTGSGLIAIMLAQRSTADITGLDIEASAVKQAEENADKCPWSDRIKIIKCDVRTFSTNEKFELIVSNPPFFETNKNLETNSRIIARQTITLSHMELLKAASALLADKGTFAVILPATIKENFIFNAWENGFWLTRCTDVKTSAGKPPKRTLLQFTNNKTKNIVCNTIVLNDHQGKRTPEYIKLTKDFYLK